MEHGKAPRRVYRLPPCPAYDVEGMEQWLSDQAERGLFLAQEGFFAGIAAFEAGVPRPVKYRLEAAQKSTSMWAEDGGEPDPEQVELGKKYDWEYVARRKDFYIYRSFDPCARELNTDPEVQALALNAVKKRQRGTVLQLLFWLVVYPLLFFRGGILLTAIHMRTWLFLLTAAFVLWMVADEVSALVCLRRIQKKLRENGCLQAGKDWRRRAVPYHARRAVQWFLGIFLVCIFLSSWSDSIMDANKVSLDRYTGTLPFATMRDFAGEEPAGYRMTMTGVHMGFNTVQIWSDWLAPVCIDYSEHAELTLADDRILSGGYYVDYYEAKSPGIARLLARELYSLDRRESGFEPMEPPDIAASCDRLYAYRNNLHFPTVVVQSGFRVIRAFFYQTADDTVPFDQWANLAAERLSQ